MESGGRAPPFLLDMLLVLPLGTVLLCAVVPDDVVRLLPLRLPMPAAKGRFGGHCRPPPHRRQALVLCWMWGVGLSVCYPIEIVVQSQPGFLGAVSGGVTAWRCRPCLVFGLE